MGTLKTLSTCSKCGYVTANGKGYHWDCLPKTTLAVVLDSTGKELRLIEDADYESIEEAKTTLHEKDEKAYRGCVLVYRLPAIVKDCLEAKIGPSAVEGILSQKAIKYLTPSVVYWTVGRLAQYVSAAAILNALEQTTGLAERLEYYAPFDEGGEMF